MKLIKLWIAQLFHNLKTDCLSEAQGQFFLPLLFQNTTRWRYRNRREQNSSLTLQQQNLCLVFLWESLKPSLLWKLCVKALCQRENRILIVLFYLHLSVCLLFLPLPIIPLLTRLIESSLGSVATKFNFFIHNLAQLRFSGLPANDEPILSFSPKTYTMKQEGRILHASIFSFQKRYNPDKHYVSLSVS